VSDTREEYMQEFLDVNIVFLADEVAACGPGGCKAISLFSVSSSSHFYQN
jgi:hypothetical protein